MSTLFKVFLGSVPVVAVLVAAAFFIPPDFPLLLRQVLLCAWAIIGMAVAERLLFGTSFSELAAAMGAVPARARAVLVALLISLPMWLFLPVYGWATGTPVGLNPDWFSILLGVILVNGIAEEVIHRAFVFGHMRREHSFLVAASISALIFGLQHLYLVLSIGPVAGGASVVLALFLAFPLALLYEHGGKSLVGPAILHISSNAPMMLFASGDAATTMLLPHMVVVLGSMYLGFIFLRWPRKTAPQVAS